MDDVQNASMPQIFSSSTARRAYICTNGDCVNRETAKRTYERLLALADQYRSESAAADQLKCKLVGCLNICKHGPTMVIHPDGVFYHSVDEENVKRIFMEHILQDHPVTELIYNHQSPPF